MKWIHVRDGLPNEGEAVFICIRMKNDKPGYDMAIYQDGTWFDDERPEVEFNPPEWWMRITSPITVKADQP